MRLQKDKSFTDYARVSFIAGFCNARRGRAEAGVSSLRSNIDAVGGKLKIVAEFTESETAITNFSDVGEYSQ